MPNLLVVDDDATLREMLNIILTVEGYTVHTAASGNAAIRVLGSDAPEDILLLDMQMADGDGESVLAWLREHPRHLRVLLTTAQPTPPPTWAQPLIEGVLQKPFGVDTLLRTLAASPVSPYEKETPFARLTA